MTNSQAHAICLMHNHFHLVVEPPEPNLVAGMRWFLGAYTTRLNHRITSVILPFAQKLR